MAKSSRSPPSATCAAVTTTARRTFFIFASSDDYRESGLEIDPVFAGNHEHAAPLHGVGWLELHRFVRSIHPEESGLPKSLGAFADVHRHGRSGLERERTFRAVVERVRPAREVERRLEVRGIAEIDNGMRYRGPVAHFDVGRVGTVDRHGGRRALQVVELAAFDEHERFHGRKHLAVLLAENAAHLDIASAGGGGRRAGAKGRIGRHDDPSVAGVVHLPRVDFRSRIRHGVAVHRHRVRAVVVEDHAEFLRAADGGVVRQRHVVEHAALAAVNRPLARHRCRIDQRTRPVRTRTGKVVVVVVVPVTVEVELPAVADFYCRILPAAESLSVGAGVDGKPLLDDE